MLSRIEEYGRRFPSGRRNSHASKQDGEVSDQPIHSQIHESLGLTPTASMSLHVLQIGMNSLPRMIRPPRLSAGEVEGSILIAHDRCVDCLQEPVQSSRCRHHSSASSRYFTRRSAHIGSL